MSVKAGQAHLPAAYRLDWSPDGRLIAIEALGDLWLITVPTGAVRRLTNTPDIQEICPIWSPDGRWLTYAQGPGSHDPELPGLTTNPVIWLMDRDGRHRHSIAIHGTPTSWRATN
jgi:TolB protein